MFKVLFNFSIAFLIVLVLIGVTVWLVRLFRANRLGGVRAQTPVTAASGDRCRPGRRKPKRSAHSSRQY